MDSLKDMMHLDPPRTGCCGVGCCQGRGMEEGRTDHHLDDVFTPSKPSGDHHLDKARKAHPAPGKKKKA
jgi:hypothetical protein